MMDHLKEMWKYYLVLILIVAVLFYPISWIYKLVDSYFGRGAAHLVLTITVISVLMQLLVLMLDIKTML